MDSCPECGSKKLKWASEGHFCSKCGLEIEKSFFSGKMLV